MLESYGVWTTAQSADTKKRGYVEVGSTIFHCNFSFVKVITVVILVTFGLFYS